MRTTFAIVLALLAGGAAAGSAEEKGLAIAVEMDTRNAGWGDMTAEMEMVLRNRQGQESHRRLRVRTLEMTNDGDRSLTLFDHPRDVKGTAFLSYTHATRPDDQWLYLPALKRVKRISSANKSGPFMGSEFAYEDLTSQEVEKYRYRWLREDQVEGRAVAVIERRPTYPNSGYTRQVAWIDRAMMQPLKVEYFDRKDAPLKTLTMHDYQPYLERHYRASRMEMVNHQTGKSTTLTWANYRFGNGLSERDFDRNSLKRAR